MNFFKKLFCRHSWLLLSWGDLVVIYRFGGEKESGGSHITIICDKCGKEKMNKISTEINIELVKTWCKAKKVNLRCDNE